MVGLVASDKLLVSAAASPAAKTLMEVAHEAAVPLARLQVEGSSVRRHHPFSKIVQRG